VDEIVIRLLMSPMGPRIPQMGDVAESCDAI